MLGTSQTLNKGRYQVINSFSHDSSGAMYEAVDTVSNVPVILRESLGRYGKVATPSQIDASNAAFAGEAKVLAEIDHESLVSVRDYFSEIDRQYLVLESLTGQNLTKYLEAGGERATLDNVLAWADQLLNGLEYLHRHVPPIIHTQIKPENLKLTSTLRIKLLTTKVSPGSGSNAFAPEPVDEDPSFGYKPLEQLWPHLGQVSQRVILNSYDERAASELLNPLDARTDLYSAAATLYHVLTGIPPCDALERSIAILDSKTDPLQNPSDIDNSIPPVVSLVFLRALAMKREDRFESAAAMLEAIRAATGSAAFAPAPAMLTASHVEAAPVARELSPDDREREILAEEARLAEEQQKLEQRRHELAAERERTTAERERIGADNEKKRLAHERAEFEAEEERRRVAQRLADLEAKSAQEKAEEERLEREAEAEQLRAEERLRELKLEQERHRVEQQRLEKEAKLELELAEERIKTLSGSERLLELDDEDLTGAETVFSVPVEETRPAFTADDDDAVFEYQEQPGFGWRMPAIIGAVVLIVGAIIGVWVFMGSSSPATVPQQVQAPAAPAEDVPPVEIQSEQPYQAAVPETQPAETSDLVNTSPADGSQSLTEKQRRPQTAAIQAKKPAVERSKKTVTVDDLINDN